jgi:hypothetical protein
MDNDRREKSAAAAQRHEANRERFRQSKIIAEKVARARALAPLNEDEAARLVAEFQAQGGQVTVCPSVEDEPSNAGTIRKDDH